MDAFSSLVNIVKDAMPMVQSGIPSVVGGFITAMFLRGNTQRVEFEKIKMGKVQEAVDDLVKNRELTLTELVKCKNLLKIAELADNEYKKKTHKQETNTNNEFDFDWFLRFFEGAGNISNENMQLLWSRILAGEVHSPSAFSLRTLETIRNMTQSEAELLHQIMQLILMNSDGSKFIYRNDYITSEGCEDEINELYGLGVREFAIMEECGILKPYKNVSYANFLEKCPYIYNGNILIEFQSKTELNKNLEKHLLYNYCEITQTAIQLIPVIDVQPYDKYILDLGLFFREKYPYFSITAHRIIENNENKFTCDFNTDLLNKHKRETSVTIPLKN